MFEFIQVTAQYSNAVLVAILPQITEFSQKLDLPIAAPITPAQVERFNCDPHKGPIGGWLRLTNGFDFWYYDGYVKGFASPDAWYGAHELGENPDHFYGPVKMNEKEAVQLVRDSLRKLAYSETALYADGTPKTIKPPVIHRKVVPRYRIQWIEPEDGGICLTAEIDAEHKTLKSMSMSNRNLSRDPPPVSVEPQPLAPGQVPDFMKDAPPQIEAMYRQMIPKNRLTVDEDHLLLVAILPLISDYGRKLNLPIHLPITTNQVARLDSQFFPGETYVWLTNGYEFVYAHGYIFQFRAPYAFFGSGKLDGRIEDYWGDWRMSEREAIKLARDAVRKLGYSLEALHLDRKPKIKKPIKIGDNSIPRYRLNWEFSIPESDGEEQGGIISATEVEVDADRKSVRSISIYDGNLIRPPPNIHSYSAMFTNALPVAQPPQFLFLTNAPPKPPSR